ncbi:fork head domain-containing protein [Phlyctema vagabunda]|uniref:Fork head domain-containing protein n=1 Tax=Phlyctema vagabunda TaxID=108571 RepID=A0ABR4PYS2_9HELO
MPVSAKRSQRARRETVNKVDAIDSSPSRPAKRRKKFEEPVEKPAAEAPKLPTNRAGIQMDDSELVTAIVPFLTVPEFHVQARVDHANAFHERTNRDGVQAYAKIAGQDWTFYVKRLRNNIGRPPEGSAPSRSPQSTPAAEDLDPSSDDKKIHIDLGPSKMISRLHAEIYFDSEAERWNIAVNGRNGIKIDNEVLRRGEYQNLVSGQVIEIGGVEMMFVLPDNNETLTVHKRYLERAGLIQPSEDNQSNGQLATPTTKLTSPLPRTAGPPGQLPIAPAPPNYQRPGTPPTSRSKPSQSVGKSPFNTNTVTLNLNGEDVDLSLDENQHIKPSYSYAQMISQAILDTEDEKLNLNGIYNFIMEKYAYYRHQLGGGWQNSIRHNLSLNKAFHKVARSTDEPGKGMKWCIVPESRDEMAQNCQRGGRGGHRGSSAPQSPGNLAYINRTKEMGSAQKVEHTPRAGSPPTRSYPPSNAPQYTPDRGGRHVQDHLPGDGSPLPRHRRPQNNTFGLSDNMPGSPPVLSSSYQDDNTSFITPAPHRVHPRLAPPSTAQRPSQHMPTSSPAPFWKYADFGNTPLKDSAFEMSPLKGIPTIPQSSSPPPPLRRSLAASPTRAGSPTKRQMPDDDLDDEDQGIDLTRGFQSIGSYHAPPTASGRVIAGAVKTHS